MSEMSGMSESSNMSKKYDIQAVLFDLDGTVLDTSAGIVRSIKDTIEHFGLKELPDSELYKFIGPPIEWSFEDKLGCTGEMNKKVSAYFRERYSNSNLLMATPYEGMFEFLKFLKDKGIPTGIATYKKDDYAKRLLCHFDFDKYCTTIHGSDYENKLTKADIIELCIQDMKVEDKSKVLMVGDSKHDATGASNIGTLFAGVSFGFGFGEFGGEDINDYEHIIYVDKMMDLAGLFE
ncbi:MAG: HAD hydrolase-like protein [Clostridia bacterium]|nr:HAD hydrolase-like protein [Clostridia bacterium]